MITYHFLIVDDDPMVAVFAKRAVQYFATHVDIRLHIAETLGDGLKLWQEQPEGGYDAVFFDGHLDRNVTSLPILQQVGKDCGTEGKLQPIKVFLCSSDEKLSLAMQNMLASWKYPDNLVSMIPKADVAETLKKVLLELTRQQTVLAFNATAQQ